MVHLYCVSGILEKLHGVLTDKPTRSRFADCLYISPVLLWPGAAREEGFACLQQPGAEKGAGTTGNHEQEGPPGEITRKEGSGGILAG